MSPRAVRRFMLLVVLTLLAVGTIEVYSASAIIAQGAYRDSGYFVRHHLVSIGLGLTMGLSCLAVPFRWLRRSAKPLVLFSLILLALVLVIGQEVGGASRWFRLGRWSVQPAEFAQLALVLYLADLLARKGTFLQDFREGFLPPVIVTGLLAGLVLMQPDLGTAISMGAIALLLLIVARARWTHVGWLIAVASVVLCVLIAAEEYRWRRLVAFANPWRDPQGSGFQILQSYLAMASGGLVGTGVGGSIQRLFYLPSAHTDFIFAIIGEELGLIGTTAVLGLFVLLIGCGIRIAVMTPDVFSKLLVLGLTGLIALEAMVHLAVVTGLLPTKGLPLPFVSYGGSSMVINLMMIALVFRVSYDAERPSLPNPVGR